MSLVSSPLFSKIVSPEQINARSLFHSSSSVKESSIMHSRMKHYSHCMYVLCLNMLFLTVLFTKHRYINCALSLYLLLSVFFCKTGFVLIVTYPIVLFSIDSFVLKSIVFHFYFTELHTWKQSGSVCCRIAYYSSAEYPSNW